MNLGISACLLGQEVRYDGTHKLDHYLRDELGRFVTWEAVCPETECGLGVPREAMRLIDTRQGIRLRTINTTIDHTDRMQGWIARKLEKLAKLDLRGFVFKSKSPSSGMAGVKLYPEGGGQPQPKGVGLFAAAFMERFPLVPVIDEGRMHDAELRENFIERIFAFDRWLTYRAEDGSAAGLVSFHARHKLLLMAHSEKHMRTLGKLVAGIKGKPSTAVLNQYAVEFMDGMRLLATVKRHTNVLDHAAGYFKRELPADAKAELGGAIRDFHAGRLPLVVPITLIRHYTRLYKEPYLIGQWYLDPQPAELMLKYHA
jgi:uncharacterized protein YbgA (DUF1722 family)/uncharacterized protein YbbK (DUF523 family)